MDGFLEIEDLPEPTPGQRHPEQVPRLLAPVAYSDFFTDYLSQNLPCVISNVSSDWKIARTWVANDSLNVGYVREEFGGTIVPVADCGKREYNAQVKSEMTLSEYLDYWLKSDGCPVSDSSPCLYLKDWHFTRDFPRERIYRVPKHFASDWLGEYHDVHTELCDDYRFVYLGPKGSWTPLHEDVFTSFSWSVNIFGRKRWLLLAPSKENRLRDALGNLPFDAELDAAAVLDGSGMYVVVQEPGDAIFVPSGWYHQVWNLENTLSVNQNWINGCNIDKMWSSLRKSLADVKKEIADCRDSDDWPEQCQKVVKALYGFDYFQFFSLLVQIGESRMRHIAAGKPLPVYGDWALGPRHLLFDLQQVVKVLRLFINDPDVTQLDWTQSPQVPTDFCYLVENQLPNLKILVVNKD